MTPPIPILGAGVSGLSTALALARAGLPVRILAAELPHDTTSAVAAAVWEPFHVGDYDPRWATRTYEHFTSLLPDPAAGVRRTECRQLFRDPLPDSELETQYWWRTTPGTDFSRLAPSDLPSGFRDGLRFFSHVVHMPDYLRWLTTQLERINVPIQLARVTNFDDLLAHHPLVINCTALGSVELCGDRNLYPAQGQVLSVPPGPTSHVTFASAGDEPVYIIPRGTDIILGGTYVEHTWSRDHSLRATADILSRCAQLIPALANSPVLAEKVGLRPCRTPGPRVELEPRTQGRAILHNYGHGGGGVTLSWGCAERVLELAQAHLARAQ